MPSGGGAVGVVGEEAPRRLGQRRRRPLRHQHPGLGDVDRLGRPPDRRRDDRHPASHRLQQHVRDPLPAGRQDEGVGSAVVVLELFLIDMAEEAHPIGDTAGCRELAEPRLVPAVPRDQQRETRQVPQRLDRQVVAFPRGGVTDGEEHRPGEPQPPADRVAVDRLEKVEIHPVEDHPHLLRRSSQFHQAHFERLADGGDPGGTLHRPEEQPARHQEPRINDHVVAQHRHHHRLAEMLPQEHRGDAVRINIVRVDQIEVETPFENPLEHRLDRRRHHQRRGAQAHFRQPGVARMIDRNAVPLLVIGHAGEGAIVAEGRILPGEPGDRRDHVRFDLAGGQEVPQSLLDEDAVAGLDTVRIERRKRDRSHGRLLARDPLLPPLEI